MHICGGGFLFIYIYVYILREQTERGLCTQIKLGKCLKMLVTASSTKFLLHLTGASTQSPVVHV